MTLVVRRPHDEDVRTGSRGPFEKRSIGVLRHADRRSLPDEVIIHPEFGGHRLPKSHDLGRGAHR